LNLRSEMTLALGSDPTESLTSGKSSGVSGWGLVQSFGEVCNQCKVFGCCAFARSETRKRCEKTDIQ
jgi:hypothetical protein